MDGETPPTSSAKRGRKSRGSKTKQSSADHFLTGSPSGQTNESFRSSEPSSSSAAINVNADEDNASSATSCSSMKSNDNLLMPPPSQPENLSNSLSQDVEMEHKGPQDHEMFVDGFSIFCFASEDEVRTALEATGNSYTNKRIETILEKGPVSSPRVPKLPSRNTNSPTGVRRTKKTKEPKTPRSSKKDLKKSPLIVDSSRASPALPSTHSETVVAASASAQLSVQTASKQGLDVKKEEAERKYADIKLSSDAVCKPPDLFKTEQIVPTNYMIKSENCKVASSSYRPEESQSIKQENNDIKEGKRAPGETSTTHLIQAPPLLKPCQSAASKRELCPDEQPTIKLAENSLRLSSVQSASSPYTPADDSFRAADTSGSTEPVQYSASAAIAALSSTPTAVASAANNTSTPSVNSRSNSVHSIGSSNSRRTTPVCTGSVSSRDNSSIRTASRSSDRNTSRGSQQPATSATELYPSPLLAHNSFSQVNPSMLSFGAANGLNPPFSYPPAAGFNQPHPNFPFGTDILSSFPHNTALPSANADALRRVLTSERPGVFPYMRPELLFPPTSGMGNSPLGSNLHTPSLMQQMLEKLPKIDPIHQMLFNQHRNTAASTAPPGLPGVPVVGPSPFQSVPGGNNSVTSPQNAQKKTGKWCSAHVRIAYHIYNNTRKHARVEESKNGVANSNSGASNVSEKPTAQASSNSVNSIASNVHRPRDIPASTQSHPKPSPVASPSVSSPLNNSRLGSSNPASPANYISTAQSTAKEMPSSGVPARLLPNGALSTPPRDLQWSKTPSSQPNPSTSSTSTASSRRVRDDRDMRKLNSSNSGLGKRPLSASSPQANKRRRSRSPGKSSRNKYPMQHQSNGHTVDKDKTLASSLPTVSMHQLYNASVMPHLNSDHKVTNGVSQSAAADMWASIMQQKALEGQGSRYMPQINPALAFGEHDRTEQERANRQRFERAKAHNPLCNPALASLNGFHPTNSLAGLGSSLIGGPPPLPTSHHSSHSQPANTGNDTYRR